MLTNFLILVNWVLAIFANFANSANLDNWVLAIFANFANSANFGKLGSHYFH